MSNQPTNLHGASGKVHTFETMARDGDWMTRSGVAVFAFRSVYHLTVVSIVEVTGRDGDLRPFASLTRAETYGADTVLFVENDDVKDRKRIYEDIANGMNQLCPELRNAA